MTNTERYKGITMGETDISERAVAFTPLDRLLSDAKMDGEGSLPLQIYRLLRELIVELRLVPNQFLSEKDVAVILGVSKTPVREAFIRLADEGIVCIVPKSGTYVSPIDFTRADEGYFVWRSLEASCASEVAVKRNIEELYCLRENLERQRLALLEDNYVDFYKCDNEFHDEMFKIAGYPAVKNLIDTARFEVDRIRNLKIRYLLRPVEEVHAEHTAIVDAIANRDSQRAGAEMNSHLSRVRDALEALSTGHELWELFHRINQSGPGKRGARGNAALKAGQPTKAGKSRSAKSVPGKNVPDENSPEKEFSRPGKE